MNVRGGGVASPSHEWSKLSSGAPNRAMVSATRHGGVVLSRGARVEKPARPPVDINS